MLVFIDESGCPGFKFTRGSDPVFGLGMIIFANGEDALATEQALLALRNKQRESASTGAAAGSSSGVSEAICAESWGLGSKT